MNKLSINEMVECSGNGEGLDCLLSVIGRVGALAGLTIASGGLAIAAAIALYMGSGVAVAVECAEWLQSLSDGE